MNISELTQSFRFVDSLTVERNDEGKIDLKMPQVRYSKSDQTPVHQYGWGPFCKFNADTSDYSGTPGVYIFTVNHQVMYIGETTNFHNRIRSGFGNISPKNCFEGGQQTNCRINNAILEVVRNGGQVALWVMETENRKQRKAELIEQCDPPWNYATPNTFQKQSSSDQSVSNRQQSSNTKSTSNQEKNTRNEYTRRTSRGKYAPLYDYLKEIDEHTLHFSFKDIEDILDAPLPKSAYEYTVWWRPTEGHSHAIGWADLDWTADPNLDNETVIFSKV